MSNTFGSLFRVTTFGESHGEAVGAVIDGCPAGLPLTPADIQPQLDRRRPGQSELASARSESDMVRILSGVADGVTLGTPIALMVANRDARPEDYRQFATIPRPSHADYTYRVKYGAVAPSGGGRASARETVARVAAGAVAERLLKVRYGVEIVAWVQSVGDVEMAETPDEGGGAATTAHTSPAESLVENGPFTRADVDASPVRCPDASSSHRMARAIGAARDDGDSLGGVVSCVCRNVPAGWGEPVFAKLEALLAQAMLSIPAVKGFEIGSGFAGTRLRGTQHNDLFVRREDGRLGTATNFSGGVQGGLANGEPVVFRVACKPPASIAREQSTADYEGHTTTLAVRGRHDPCVVPRAVPIVEAMAALVLADLALSHESRYGT
jgi:chorismate synthase